MNDPIERTLSELDSVLLATNKWRLVMWSLRLQASTSDEVRLLITRIMDLQLELEENARLPYATSKIDGKNTATQKE